MSTDPTPPFVTKTLMVAVTVRADDLEGLPTADTIADMAQEGLFGIEPDGPWRVIDVHAL